MSIVLHGEPIVKQGDRIVKGPDGWTTIESYEGLEASLKQLQLEMDLAGYQTELSPLGARRELRVVKPFNSVTWVLGGEDPINESWSVRSQEIRRDLASHPFLVAAIEDANERARRIAVADNAIANGTVEEYLMAPAEYDWDAALKKYVRYRMMGTNYYVVYAPVVVRTIGAATASTIRAEMPEFDIPKIVKSTEIPAPSEIMFRIPKDWEWMMPAPQVLPTGDPKRFRIEQEWIGAKQYADLYEGGTFVPA